MARPRSGTKESNEPNDWKRGQREARAAREHVAAQLADALVARDQTGSMAMVRRRAGELSDAERSGDRLLERGATWELALACAAHVVALDLHQPRGVRAA